MTESFCRSLVEVVSLKMVVTRQGREEWTEKKRERESEGLIELAINYAVYQRVL